jgi:hypothetical protein
VSDLALRCACGAVRGRLRDVSANSGNRLVCYCDDCQAFAHFLGHADAILDAQGGSDLFQLAPARIEITQGADRLACVRLTSKGLLRWYADCCKTPIANTMASSRAPFAGMLHSFVDHARDGRSRDEALGPVLGRVFARFRVAPDDPNAPPATERPSASIIFRSVRKLLMAWLRGEAAPSPFFDAQTGEPRATPKVLSDEELRALKGRPPPVTTAI